VAVARNLLDGPRELIDNDSRLIPGDGIAPVELFRRKYVTGDPFEVGSEIRRKCTAVMRTVGVA